jgi:hypothetical protein
MTLTEKILLLLIKQWPLSSIAIQRAILWHEHKAIRWVITYMSWTSSLLDRIMTWLGYHLRLTQLWRKRALAIMKREWKKPTETTIWKISPQQPEQKPLCKVAWVDVIVSDEVPHKLNLIKKTYLVNTWTEKRTFEWWQNGISMPNFRWEYSLQFENSRIQRVKSFYKALWLFLEEIDK